MVAMLGREAPHQRQAERQCVNSGMHQLHETLRQRLNMCHVSQGNQQEAAGGLAVVSALPDANTLLAQILAQVQQGNSPQATQNLGKAVATASGKGANNPALANALNQVWDHYALASHEQHASCWARLALPACIL